MNIIIEGLINHTKGKKKMNDHIKFEIYKPVQMTNCSRKKQHKAAATVVAGAAAAD